MDELSIVIPVLSEFEKLPSFIDELVEYLKANPGDIDVIIVVDEIITSPESIMAYVSEKYPWLKFRVLQRTGKGSIQNYGAMVRFGMAYSMSKYVVLVSPHGEDDLSIIAVMLKKIRSGCQVVQATRFTSKGSAKNVTFLFRVFQVLYRLSMRLLAGLNISDSTYAFKMFDRVFIQTLGISRNRFSVCPEITIKSLLAGGRVEYIASTVKPIKGIKEFKLMREGSGYFLVILRALMHRIGVRWF
jgi:Glycosyl transferase family 2